MKPTLVVWHRYGKEHGEDGNFRVNPPAMIDDQIRQRVEHFSATDKNKWKWYQVSEQLIVERMFWGEETNTHEPRRTVYYLPEKFWAVQEFFHAPSLGPQWSWYVHIGSTTYSERWQSWIFKDLFSDVIFQDDLKTHSVLDLDEVAQAHDMGLINDEEMKTILNSTQELVDILRHGEFPPPELREREDILKELGWE